MELTVAGLSSLSGDSPLAEMGPGEQGVQLLGLFDTGQHIVAKTTADASGRRVPCWSDIDSIGMSGR